MNLLLITGLLLLTTPREHLVEQARGLEARLKTKIFGQDEAVRETANVIIRYAAGVNDPLGPVGALLYCGPSGVGKTELAKQLCLELYGTQDCFIRINMSEYGEPHSVSKLIGAPPGYIGFDGGGGLTNRLLETPQAVVLLDEIEKAHPTVLKLFLHVFDAGYITSSSGQDVNCQDAVFILTSNLGSTEIAKLFQDGFDHKEILAILQPHLMDVLSPELYNRLDCMVFAPLSHEIFEKLIKKLLTELSERVYKAREICVCFDQSVVEFLKKFSLDPKLGARPLKRVVEKQLTTVIAQAIIDADCNPGDGIVCSYEDGKIVLHIVLRSDLEVTNQKLNATFIVETVDLGSISDLDIEILSP